LVTDSPEAFPFLFTLQFDTELNSGRDKGPYLSHSGAPLHDPNPSPDGIKGKVQKNMLLEDRGASDARTLTTGDIWLLEDGGRCFR
jgi:hypothetical protein